MSKQAVFVQHRTQPGKREAVQQVWRKHMEPAISANPGHQAYFYCFGSDPDVICAFQVYASAEAAAEFLKSPQYAAYNEEVMPLLLGEPSVTALDVQWSKGATD